jgi:signal transduction histidine kinase
LPLSSSCCVSFKGGGWYDPMNAEQSRWSRSYRAALRKYVERGAGASLEPALRLGRRALTLGLEPLTLAGIHEQSLIALGPRSGSAVTGRRMTERARTFFMEAIVPIEMTHRAAVNADACVEQAARKLRLCSEESSASTRHLKRGIARRRTAEAALSRSRKHRMGLLRESQRLQASLRKHARKILLAQEGERKKVSRELRDEIAQVLLAVNIRLGTLRMAIKTNTRGLKKEIAVTQRLVKQSVRTIHRLARGGQGEHEA